MARKIWKGNEAAAAAAIQAGCNFYAGYPITPQNELMELLSWKLPENNGVFVQAESELGAINMVKGAAIGGGVAMTATSGPGLSLMQEGIASMATARVPCVVIDMQRAVDFINPAQYDYGIATKAVGHSGLHIPVYTASTIQEMMDITMLAFQKAEKYRTPVYLLFDGMLGQMMEQAELPASQVLPKRGWGCGPTEGKRPRIKFMDSPAMVMKGQMGFDANEEKLRELRRLFEEWHKTEVICYEHYMEDAEYVVASYGSAARIALDAIVSLREAGKKVGLFQAVSLFPFPNEQLAALHSKGVKGILTVEMSPIAQFENDVRLAVGHALPVQGYSRYGANIVLPSEIAAAVSNMMG